MAAEEHSALLKFLVDKPNSTMSSSSPTIESTVPRVQKLRSVTDTTSDIPEWKITDNTGNSDEHSGSVDLHDAKSLATENIVNVNIDDKEDVQTPEIEENNSNGDFTELKQSTKDKDNLTNHDYIDNSETKGNELAGKDDFVYSPVITVTKEESTLTKGDLKLQKVVVSEDISNDPSNEHESDKVTQDNSYNQVHTEIQSEVLPVSIRTDQNADKNSEKHANEDLENNGVILDKRESKRNETKIPRLRLKQVVERIKKEQQEKRITKNPEPSSEQKRRSSIPRSKDVKNSPQDIQKESTGNKKVQETPKVDDEFDKIYEEIIESEASNNVPSPEKISNPMKLESKFEEIIHAYNENDAEPMSIEKTKSKIPLLRRRSEQEIEAMPPTTQKHSFKRSKSEVYKNKSPISLSREKSLKSDFESVKSSNNGSHETYKATANIKSEILSHSKNNNISINSSAKKDTINKNMNAKENVNITTKETIEKVQNTSNSNENKFTKCKIPTVKEGLESRINSATLNKHPTRKNIEKLSHNINSSEKTDKITTVIIKNIVDQSQHANQKEKYDQNEKKPFDLKTSQEKNIRLQTETKTKTFVNPIKKEMDINKFTPSNIPNTDTNLNRVSAKISPTSQDKILIPTNDKFKIKIDSDRSKVDTKEPGGLNITSPRIIKSSNIKLLEEDASNHKTMIDGKTNKKSEHIKRDNATGQNVDKTELIVETATIKIRNEDNTTKDNLITYNKTKHKFENNSLSEQKEINYQEEHNSNTDIPSQVSLDTNAKPTLGNDNLTVLDKENTNTLLPDLETNKLKGNNEMDHFPLTSINKENIDKNNQSKQPLYISDNEIIPIMEPLNMNTNTSSNVNRPIASAEDNEGNKMDKTILTDSEKDKIQDKNVDIGDKEEEEIIILKGKVNRVIRRLDSKDYKTVRKELDDVPKEVSVISKIAMFERCTSMDPLASTSERGESLPQDVPNDEPIIVDEVLKTDVSPSDGEDDPAPASVLITTNNDRATIRNDLEVKKVRSGSTRDSKSTDGKAVRRTISSVHSDVFADENEKSSFEVWNEYRRKKEDAERRRARSLAELDLGEAVRGRVRQLVSRLGAGERAAGAGGAARGRSRGGAVQQTIAMYERRLTPTREQPPGPRSRTPPAVAAAAAAAAAAEAAPTLGSEQLARRVAALQQARAQHGSADVPRVQLADGGSMPVLALGTALLEPALIPHVVRAGIELGYRAIDCAAVYGTERAVGAAVRDAVRDGLVTRSELFIINKLWSTQHRRDLVARACRRSLASMGLDYFDLYLIHNPMSFKEGDDPLPRVAGVLQYSSHDYLEAWFGIEGLVAEGLVRRGGLSNFNSQQLERVVDKARIKPVVNQVECHPYLTQLRLEEACLARGVRLSCFGVLGSPGTPRALTSGLAPALADPLVQVMAAGLGLTPAQLLISYQVRLGRAVVVKCSRAEHLAQALAAVAPAPASASAPASARLQAAHVAALSALNRNKRIFTFKGMGDTHRNYPFRIPF